MKKLSFILCLLALTLILFAQQTELPKLSGPFLGQNPPEMVPEIFAPGIVSNESHEFSCCFSPVGNEFYFTRMIPEQRQNFIMVTKMIDGVWTEPAVASFAGPFTFEPFVTPDNKRVYFQTGKVADGKLLMYTMYADRTENGWSEPKDPGDVFNPMKTMHISSTTDGTIYTTDISGGMGSEALGIIRKTNGKYEKLEKLGLPFNADDKQQHPWIAPDESYMVFTVHRPGQVPLNVLFCSFRDVEGKWTEPVELKLGREAGQPFVTSDGKYLFFSGGAQGKGDIFWVSTKIIEVLRPNSIE